MFMLFFKSQMLCLSNWNKPAPRTTGNYSAALSSLVKTRTGRHTSRDACSGGDRGMNPEADMEEDSTRLCRRGDGPLWRRCTSEGPELWRELGLTTGGWRQGK